MVFINSSNIIGIIVGQAAQTTFGDMVLALSSILIILTAIALMFGVKMEYTFVLLTPLLLAYAAYYSQFLAVLSVIIIYLSLIISKNFIFK